MEIDLILRGTIAYFSPERHFGFIDCETHKGVFFYIDTVPLKGLPKDQLSKVKSNYLKGDEVYFKLRPSNRNDKGFEAYDLHFIKNEKIDEFFKHVAIENELVGFLKKIDNKYYVKDKISYLFIPIKVSIWEVNIEQVYENRLNELVNYTLVKKDNKPNKLKAILVDRIISKDYYELETYKKEETQLLATITGKNEDGYFATLLDNLIKIFIPFEKDGTIKDSFQKKEQVRIIIKSLNDSSVRVQLC